MIIFLYIFFLILNQKITLEICLFGVVIVGAVMLFMCRKLDYSLKKEWWIYKCFGLALIYICVLVWEIIKANFTLARLILIKNSKFTPTIVHITAPLKSRLLRTIYANSITLTPGTITIDEDMGKYIVHCLDEPMSKGLEDTKLLRLLIKMEAKK